MSSEEDNCIPAKRFRERVNYLKNEKKRLNMINSKSYEDYLCRHVESTFEYAFDSIMDDINKATEEMKMEVELYTDCKIKFPKKYNDGTPIDKITRVEKINDVRNKIIERLKKLGFEVDISNIGQSFEKMIIDWKYPTEYKPEEDLK